MSVEDQKVLELEQRKEKIYFGGGTKAIEKQKAMGKMTARERIIALLDEGSFHEYDMFVEHDGRDFGMQDKSLPGDGVIIGTGMICGQPIAIFAQDFTVAGGSLGFMHARKITKIMDYALNMRIPLIGINDSGGAVYSPALTDFVFVVENISKMFITGPEVIKTVLGEEISMEELGGARVHSEMTGNAHFFAQSEDECFVQIRKLISMIPMNNTTKAEKIAPAAPLPQYDITSIVPSDPTVPYDVRDVIKALVDESEFLEVMELFAANIVVGFGRIAGESVGFIANQPLVMAGVLDCDSSDKAARFIRFCDCFNIPIVTLEDLPGYLPGVDQEHAGVIRHGAKMLYAYSEATVPSITVVLRKAYGGGYIAMGSRHLRADFVFAWPLAEIAVMGPEGAANIIFKKDIVGAENPAEMRKLKIQEYKEKFANPYVAAAKGYIDSVIAPAETRMFIEHALKVSAHKNRSQPSKKHGNPPF